MKTEVVNGSRFLSCKGRGKRIHTDVPLESAEHASKLPKPKALSQSGVSQLAPEFSNCYKGRHKSLFPSSTNGVWTDPVSDRNLATVIVSKGIEMKRTEAKVWFRLCIHAHNHLKNNFRLKSCVYTLGYL